MKLLLLYYDDVFQLRYPQDRRCNCHRVCWRFGSSGGRITHKTKLSWSIKRVRLSNQIDDWMWAHRLEVAPQKSHAFIPKGPRRRHSVFEIGGANIKIEKVTKYLGWRLIETLCLDTMSGKRRGRREKHCLLFSFVGKVTPNHRKRRARANREMAGKVECHYQSGSIDETLDFWGGEDWAVCQHVEADYFYISSINRKWTI